MIGRAVDYLRDEVGLKGVWLGMDPKNEGARLFYERLGFKGIPGAPSDVLGLTFKDWEG